MNILEIMSEMEREMRKEAQQVDRMAVNVGVQLVFDASISMFTEEELQSEVMQEVLTLLRHEVMTCLYESERFAKYMKRIRIEGISVPERPVFCVCAGNEEEVTTE